MSDRFFETRTCDRCKSSLAGKTRKMSWFNMEVLCETCIEDEKSVKSKLRSWGINVNALEGKGRK